MKPRFLMCFSVIALFAALAIPVQFAAQDDTAQANKPKHHHYQLVVLGTLGGPQSYGDAGHGAANLTNDGTAVGVADTAIPDPFYPNFNQLFSGLIGQYPYVYHAFTTKGGALVDLGGLAPNYSSVPTYMSANGLVSGESLNGTIDPFTGWPAESAVLWKNGEIVNLGTLGGYESQAGGRGVNSRGQVTGFATNDVPDPFSIIYRVFYGLSNATQTRAFLWDEKNGMRDLGTLGGPDAVAPFINERGQIAGSSYTNYTPNPTTGIPTVRPFLWENGRMIDLGSLGGTGCVTDALNNRGQVVGLSNLAGDMASHAVLWDNGKLTDIGTLGGTYGEATAINEAGEIAGLAYLVGDQVGHAFFWSRGVLRDLGTLEGDCFSGAFGINASGQVVGQSISCDGNQRAFLWENGNMIDLNVFVPPGSDITLTEVEQINDSGEMFGIGTLSNGNDRAFLLIPCDGKHPGIEGCDYSLVDATTAAQVRAPQSAQSSKVENENQDRFMGLRDRLDSRLIHRRGYFGMRSPNN